MLLLCKIFFFVFKCVAIKEIEILCRDAVLLSLELFWFGHFYLH